MKIKIAAAAAAMMVLAGCGTMAPNADVNQGVTGISGRTAVIVDNSGITVSETGPSVQDGGRRVFGTSCKNKLWDPDPSEANAVALMNNQAQSLGYSHIHSVEVRKDSAAIAKNCWSAIVAEGIAFNRRSME